VNLNTGYTTVVLDAGVEGAEAIVSLAAAFEERCFSVSDHLSMSFPRSVASLLVYIRLARSIASSTNLVLHILKAAWHLSHM
jgi:hypothetical protein